MFKELLKRIWKEEDGYIIGAGGYQKPTTNTRYSRPPSVSANRYSPIPSRSVSSYGRAPSRYRPSSYNPSSMNLPSFGGNPSGGGYKPQTPSFSRGSSRVGVGFNPSNTSSGGVPGYTDLESDPFGSGNAFSGIGNSIKNWWSGLGQSSNLGSQQNAIASWASSLFNQGGEAQSGMPNPWEGLNIQQIRQREGGFGESNDPYGLAQPLGYDPNEIKQWEMESGNNMSNMDPFEMSRMLSDPGFIFPQDRHWSEDQGIDNGQGNGIDWSQFDQGPEMPYGDPMQQAQEYLEWMKQQRVSGVNTAIDNYLDQLGIEEGRVGPYYDELKRNLGVTRGAAMEGSDATQAGVNKEYTRDRLGLVDFKDQLKQDTHQNLASRGMLNSGAADKAFRNIDKVVTTAISSAMKDKNIKIEDILEGKENVQNVYTTAIKNAQQQQMEYLKGIEAERTSAEKQRGQETMNIGNELAAQLPIMSRQIQNDQFSQGMQKANMNNSILGSLIGASGGGGGASWMDQAMMQYRYDQMAQDEGIANMIYGQQNQPNYGGLYGELGAAYGNPDQMQFMMNNSGLLGNSLNMDPQMVLNMIYGNARNQGQSLAAGSYSGLGGNASNYTFQ